MQPRALHRPRLARREELHGAALKHALSTAAAELLQLTQGDRSTLSTLEHVVLWWNPLRTVYSLDAVLARAGDVLDASALELVHRMLSLLGPALGSAPLRDVGGRGNSACPAASGCPQVEPQPPVSAHAVISRL